MTIYNVKLDEVPKEAQKEMHIYSRKGNLARVLAPFNWDKKYNIPTHDD